MKEVRIQIQRGGGGQEGGAGKGHEKRRGGAIIGK